MSRDISSRGGYKATRDYRKRSPESRNRSPDLRYSRRSRSRSPVDRKNRSRSRDRDRRLRDRRDRDNEKRRSPPSSKSKKSKKSLRTEKIDLESCQGIDEEMMKLMGFGDFNTTKNKKVADNTGGSVKINKPRKYRQYMNRKGGFNRPLDYVA